MKIDTVNKIIDTTPKKKGRPKGSVKNKVNIIWAPQPKQEEALVRNEFEILYGGARGGGKTDAGQAWLLYEKDKPKFRALVIRQNAKDLNDWLDRAKTMYRFTGAEFVGSPMEIRFPSGAKIRTGHLKDENAYTQYQGHEYQKMLIEELTQIPSENLYEKLIASCRSTVEGIDPQVFCTTNPGEIGHTWVKKRWRIEDKANWGKPFLAMTAVVGDKIINRERIFIHSKVEDNPKLVEMDPGYVAMLESLSDENLKKSWREGSWDDPVIPGQIYKDELEAAKRDGRIGQVPYDSRYPVHTYWDIGVGDNMAIWFMQFTGGHWKAIEYYQNSGKGFSHYRDVLNDRGYFYGQHFGPHDLRKRQVSSGEMAETITDIAQQLGINFYILPKEAVNKGILTVKEKFGLVHFDEKKCEIGLEALKTYHREYDEEAKTFSDKPVHDWSSNGADAFRYWAMAPEPVVGELQSDFSLYSQQTYQ